VSALGSAASTRGTLSHPVHDQRSWARDSLAEKGSSKDALIDSEAMDLAINRIFLLENLPGLSAVEVAGQVAFATTHAVMRGIQASNWRMPSASS